MTERAEILIFAEFRYKLWINGRFVQTGPTPCQPSHRLLDRHDAHSFFRPGRNCIAVAVHCPGIMTGQWTLVNPALLVALLIDDQPVLNSDASWQTLAGDAWRHPTQLCGYAKGFHEWVDLARLPQGWTDPGFDSSRWEAAVELPFYAYGRPDELAENYMGYPTLHLHSPARLVNAGIADGIVTEAMRREAGESYTWARNRWLRMFGRWNLDHINVPLDAGEPLPEPVAERANRESHQPVPEGMVRAPAGGVFPLAITIPAQGHPFINFDLGVIRSGLLQLEIESASGGTVDLAWDDRCIDGRVPLSRSTPNCDRIQVQAGRITWESFFERGLRYLQVILRDFRGTVALHHTGVRETLLPIPASEPATFVSSDELLNRIWQASVETTRQYMNGCAAGDPIRERCHWLHDDAMAMRMAFYVCGDWSTWRRALELTAQSQSTEGWFPVISPGHFEDYNMVISSCYWAVQVMDYFRHTGDDVFARRMLPHVRRHVDYELRFADAYGLLFETPGRRFLSWADGDPCAPYAPGETWAKTTRKSWGDFFDPPTRGYNAIINTSWLWCLREGVDLAERLGEAGLAARWRTLFSTARQAFDRRFWDATFGLHRDNVVFDRDGTPNAPTFCESTLFMLMRAGLLSGEQGLGGADRIMAPDFVCCRTSGGLEGGAYPVFLLEHGRTAEALAYYLDRWGEPIKAGATTCGEEFFQGTGNSDCHIHGATPARDFLEFLAGIRLLAPGWDTVLLAPPVGCPELPELRASVPTPHGRIEVEIVRDAQGRAIYRYALPTACRGFLRLASGLTPITATSGTLAL
ncbi:MAG: alpha-L-rhamnosidase C-terminal domain-containing protein [Chthoniobacterales bacterium]